MLAAVCEGALGKTPPKKKIPNYCPMSQQRGLDVRATGAAQPRLHSAYSSILPSDKRGMRRIQKKEKKNKESPQKRDRERKEKPREAPQLLRTGGGSPRLSSPLPDFTLHAHTIRHFCCCCCPGHPFLSLSSCLRLSEERKMKRRGETTTTARRVKRRQASSETSLRRVEGGKCFIFIQTPAEVE